MDLLVSDIEAELVARAREGLVLLGLSTATDGTNADLAGSIAFGLRQAGVTLAGLSATDAELVNFDTALLDEVFDLAELRLVMLIYARLNTPSAQVGPLARVEWGQVMNKYRDYLDRLLARVAKLYAYGRVSLEAGVIDLAFTEPPTVVQ